MPSDLLAALVLFGGSNLDNPLPDRSMMARRKPTRANSRRRRTARQERADERQAAYDKLTPGEKIERAIKRGHPESREVKRLRWKAAA